MSESVKTQASVHESLMTVVCWDDKSEIRLSNYADMIVRNKQNQIAAIRFGGYPEMVRAMADCVAAGCTLNVRAGSRDIVLKSDKPNGYYRKVSHDGLYAEAILYLKDDETKSLSLTGDDGEKTTVNAKRNLYIFCEDSDKDTLFHELDRKLSVPLIPAFKDYFIAELKNRNILNVLKVWCRSGQFYAYHLEVTEDETEIAAVLEDGLKSGAIEIPGVKFGEQSDFENIESFTGYLNTFAAMIAGRIKSSFIPLFDPETEEVCDRLKTVDSYIAQNAGYHLYPAQLACSEALKRITDKDNIALIVAECGSGKTKIGAAALYAGQKKKHLTQSYVLPIFVRNGFVRLRKACRTAQPSSYVASVTPTKPMTFLKKVIKQSIALCQKNVPETDI